MVFTIEAILKILGLGVYSAPHSYFRDNWNILDFTILIGLYVDDLISRY